MSDEPVPLGAIPILDHPGQVPTGSCGPDDDSRSGWDCRAVLLGRLAMTGFS
jgi:hypothetical protein